MHTELTEASENKNRGSVIAFIRIITNTIGIITPIFSGFIISKYGFHYTFFIGVLISFFALIPIFYLKEKNKKEVI
jgi:MFS family permease